MASVKSHGTTNYTGSKGAALSGGKSANIKRHSGGDRTIRQGAPTRSSVTHYNDGIGGSTKPVIKTAGAASRSNRSPFSAGSRGPTRAILPEVRSTMKPKPKSPAKTNAGGNMISAGKGVSFGKVPQASIEQGRGPFRSAGPTGAAIFEGQKMQSAAQSMGPKLGKLGGARGSKPSMRKRALFGK